MTRVSSPKFVMTRVQACAINESFEVTMKRTCSKVCRVKLIANIAKQSTNTTQDRTYDPRLVDRGDDTTRPVRLRQEKIDFANTSVA
ncbi:hypothetical protein AVEN_124284-1 [Araneus ventricosus]|uniref:Uncharacterized protein n=1 Tax=Araneus ventricosus TaxID=182803 RepID=A0A4Y2KV41_ARAVE|nr:hypothetical protein AVEN_124284-1 [Araneus ventricosus]